LTRYEVSVHDDLSLPLFQLEDARAGQTKEAQLDVVNDGEWLALLSALSGGFPHEVEEYGKQAPDEAGLAKLRERLAAGPLFFFAPRNLGPTASNPAAKPQTQLRRRYMLLGESLEGMQAWDVNRAAQAIGTLRDTGAASLRVSARGNLAAVALYGAVGRSPRWQQPWPWPNLELVAPPATHRTGAPFFHVLRYLDMPQAVTLAAEYGQVKLVDVNEDDWRFALETAKNLNWKDKLTIVPHETAAGK
jgi:hypothetical protein